MRQRVALLVDDQKSICQTLADVISDEGWDSISASSGIEALALLKKVKVDLVFLDIWMKGLDGIETLQKIKERDKTIPIVVMSGHATIDTAVKATRLGAMEFLEKPLSIEKIIPILEYAAKLSDLTADLPEQDAYQLIGKSPLISVIRRKIEVIAPRNSWVLITGENGTGKEVVARNVHSLSKRAGKPFVAVNCAAIPEELIESELFGYQKGAFTSAYADKIGKFELAHKGTLFLDEIGDMSLKTQAKILRILQEQKFERVGGTELVSVDVRVIAATNKDLQQEIREGNFREDLFYRLNVIPLHMPPLRERKDDVLVLCDHFLAQMAYELGDRVKVLSEEAKQILKEYRWPGNVRELRNLLERMTILIQKDIIELEDLKELFLEKDDFKSISSHAERTLSLKEARRFFEKTFILEKLQENDWNISKTAEIIGIERSNLHRKLRAFNIDLKSLKVD